MNELGYQTLSDLLSGGIYAFFLILARVGMTLHFLPGFGDTYVNNTTRFTIAAGLSLILLPILYHLLPAIPVTASGFVMVFTQELLWGFFLGGSARILMMALDLAGNMIATNTGLSAATTYNPQLTSSGPIITQFLTIGALLILFSTNMHHLLIGALIKSYDFYKPGEPLVVMDMAQGMIQTISHAMAVGFQMASPFVVLGLVFNVGLGLIARMVPQMQVFQVGVPLQIMVGMTVLAGMLMTLLQVWIKDFESFYISLIH